MNIILFLIWVMYDMKILVKCEIGMGKESFNYERQNNYGLGHRPMNMIVDTIEKLNINTYYNLKYHCACGSATEYRENYRRAVAANPKHRPFFDNNPYPASLPPDSMTHYPTPYKSIYQGSRKPGDTRVYNYKFDYEPKIIGHQISANGLFNCLITHLAVETTGAIPILLRGGAKYRFFTVIVKAKAGVPLKGKIRAYCQNAPDEGIDLHASVDTKRK